MSVGSLGLLALASAVRCQVPPLAPTSSVSIPTAGVLHYASIHVPAGVTVNFNGSAPALLRVDGDVQVDGAITVTGSGGGSAHGSGGSYCSGTIPPSGWSAGNGYHAGVYGSAMPFTFEGGSPGGGLSLLGPQFFPYSPCSSWNGYIAGSPGGGTLAIVAGGRIDVNGSVRADGLPGFQYFMAMSPIATGSGSGGSILLAGGQGVTVAAGATVSAAGWSTSSPFPPVSSQHGYVRFDALGGPPVVAATVVPAPLLVELPHLRAPLAPQIGSQWSLEVRAPTGDAALVAVSFTAIAPILTPFGLLGIDPALAVPIGIAALPDTVVDPSAAVTLAIPPNPTLVGAGLWLQAIDFVAPGSPRLSNRVDVIITQ